MSDYLKKHLTAQLELLNESSFHLQNSISDFVLQITTIAKESVNNTSDTNMTVKDAITMVTKAQSELHEHIHLLTELTDEERKRESLKQTQADNFSDTFLADSNIDAMRRLKDIEKCISFLQDTKQKTDKEISEIKQWRDNFVTEHIGNGIIVEKLSKKQKHNFENIKKHIHEQDNKIEKLFEEIERIKEKEAISDKLILKTSIDLKDYKCNLDQINTLFKDLTDKVELFSQEISSYSDLTSTIQGDGKKNTMYTTNTREKLQSKTEPKEKEVLKFSQDTEKSTNELVKFSSDLFVASQGRWNGKSYSGFNVITFSAVERNVGNHFDPKTGVFTAPSDGLYTTSLTIKQTEDSSVIAGVRHTSGGLVSRLGGIQTTEKSVEVSRTFEFRMKARDVLYSCSSYRDCECTHFSCSRLL